ncbi:uncharacterized protein EV420DRAFT_1640995 [Desarmillaria tabescens]|uniref:Uncharacterized protein n=1 Tax=Armillaria tabescens TaxID=1929756 RepID=A0AA39N7H5_ARMTA|nr:uncharacterized protein EV420DRAFT_1640995 [Desarmillaria tabescens]KAK0460448.1 hypothetical protein EV420DRAFT_1640995 [Desarmillaria tabescens]
MFLLREVTKAKSMLARLGRKILVVIRDYPIFRHIMLRASCAQLSTIHGQYVQIISARVFASGAISPGGPKEATMDEISEKIRVLEEKEKDLAKQYGMTGDIDSIEVRGEAKARAFSELGNSQLLSDLSNLQELYDNRRKFEILKLHLRKGEGFSSPLHVPLHHVGTSRFWSLLMSIRTSGYLKITFSIQRVFGSESTSPGNSVFTCHLDAFAAVDASVTSSLDIELLFITVGNIISW